MYAGAFAGFVTAWATGSPLLGLGAAIAVGLGAGAVMALMTVTFGANQHVSGIGLTIALIGLSEFTNRLIFAGGELQRIEPMPTINPFGELGGIGAIFDQYGLTWLAFLVVVPAAWWLLQRSSFGLEVRAVGENPEAADAAGVNVVRTRYLALMIGGALMAIGGAFITLALLGSFTLDIIAGRGWVCVALVIFGRWRIGRGVIGALIFSLVFSLQFRLRILPGFGELPFELLLALPYLVVIGALALSGRNVAYPGAYLKPYRRS
jgi:simple sugar transport system permease protein